MIVPVAVIVGVGGKRRGDNENRSGGDEKRFQIEHVKLHRCGDRRGAAARALSTPRTVVVVGAMMVMAAPVRRRGVRTLVTVVRLVVARLIVIASVVMDDAARQDEGQRGENRNGFQRR